MSIVKGRSDTTKALATLKIADTQLEKQGVRRYAISKSLDLLVEAGVRETYEEEQATNRQSEKIDLRQNWLLEACSGDKPVPKACEAAANYIKSIKNEDTKDGLIKLLASKTWSQEKRLHQQRQEAKSTGSVSHKSAGKSSLKADSSTARANDENMAGIGDEEEDTADNDLDPNDKHEDDVSLAITPSKLRPTAKSSAQNTQKPERLSTSKLRPKTTTALDDMDVDQTESDPGELMGSTERRKRPAPADEDDEDVVDPQRRKKSKLQSKSTRSRHENEVSEDEPAFAVITLRVAKFREASASGAPRIVQLIGSGMLEVTASTSLEEVTARANASLRLRGGRYDLPYVLIWEDDAAVTLLDNETWRIALKSVGARKDNGTRQFDLCLYDNTKVNIDVDTLELEIARFMNMRVIEDRLRTASILDDDNIRSTIEGTGDEKETVKTVKQEQTLPAQDESDGAGLRTPTSPAIPTTLPDADVDIDQTSPRPHDEDAPPASPGHEQPPDEDAPPASPVHIKTEPGRQREDPHVSSTVHAPGDIIMVSDDDDSSLDDKDDDQEKDAEYKQGPDSEDKGSGDDENGNGNAEAGDGDYQDDDYLDDTTQGEQGQGANDGGADDDERDLYDSISSQLEDRHGSRDHFIPAREKSFMTMFNVEKIGQQQRVNLPAWNQDSLPFAMQVFSAKEAMSIEMENRESPTPHKTQRLGGIVGHTMGYGKTFVMIVKVILNACFLKNDEEVAFDRQHGPHPRRHLPDNSAAGSKCPSGPWHGCLPCRCEPDHPMGSYVPLPGATVVVTSPIVVDQLTREFKKHIDAQAFQRIFGHQYQVLQAYTNDAQYSEFTKVVSQVAAPTPTLQQWLDAQGQLKTPVELYEAWLRDHKTVHVPELQAEVLRRARSGIIIVTSPICFKSKAVPTFSMKISPPNFPDSLACTRVVKAAPADSTTRTRSSTAVKGLKQAQIVERECWWRECRGGNNKHNTVRHISAVERARVALATIMIDEFHDHMDSVFTRSIPDVLIRQRKMGIEGAVVTGFSGTPMAQTPFDIVTVLKLGYEGDKVLRDSFLSVGDTALARYARRGLPVILDQCKLLMKYIVEASDRSLTQQKRLQSCRQAERMLARVPEVNELTGVRPLKQLLQHTMKDVLDQYMHRYDENTQWQGQRLVDIPVPVHEVLQVEQRQSEQELLLPTLQQLSKSRRQLESDSVSGEEQQGMLSKIKRLNVRFMLNSAFPALQVYHDAQKDKAVYLSDRCKEKGYYSDPASHPLAGELDTLLSSCKMQAICRSMLEKYQQDGGKRVVNNVDRMQPVIITVHRTVLAPLVVNSLHQFFKDHRPRIPVSARALTPDMTTSRRSQLVQYFQFPGEYKGKEVDVLVVPTNLGTVGINLAFCSLMYHLEVIPKAHKHQQIEGRINRIGQRRTPTFIQLVDTTWNVDQQIIDARTSSVNFLAPVLNDSKPE